MDVGKKIRELREKRGLEQLELADKINISQSKMNKIETGYQKRLEPEILKDIAKALGVTTDYLLSHADETHSSIPYTAPLTTKDERDIAKRLEQIKDDMEHSGDLAFDGEPLSEEAMESFLEAMEYVVRTTKKINKKYTPKKYRKDEQND